MKKIALVVLLAACGETASDVDAGIIKGAFDTGALQSGLTVQITGNLGEVTLPLKTALPTVDASTFSQVLKSKGTITVTSPRTKASADLMQGSYVAGTPGDIGQYHWAVDSTRKHFTVTFYNSAGGVKTLKPGNDYDVSFAMGANDYVEAVSTMTFKAHVQ